MSDQDKKERELKHELGNAKQEKLVLQNLLARASEEIEQLAESDCAEPQKEQAIQAARKFRRASSL
jgi:hypothetical protein